MCEDRVSLVRSADGGSARLLWLSASGAAVKRSMHVPAAASGAPLALSACFVRFPREGEGGDHMTAPGAGTGEGHAADWRLAVLLSGRHVRLLSLQRETVEVRPPFVVSSMAAFSQGLLLRRAATEAGADAMLPVVYALTNPLEEMRPLVFAAEEVVSMQASPSPMALQQQQQQQRRPGPLAFAVNDDNSNDDGDGEMGVPPTPPGYGAAAGRDRCHSPLGGSGGLPVRDNSRRHSYGDGVEDEVEEGGLDQNFPYNHELVCTGVAGKGLAATTTTTMEVDVFVSAAPGDAQVLTVWRLAPVSSRPDVVAALAGAQFQERPEWCASRVRNCVTTDTGAAAQAWICNQFSGADDCTLCLARSSSDMQRTLISKWTIPAQAWGAQQLSAYAANQPTDPDPVGDDESDGGISGGTWFSHAPGCMPTPLQWRMAENTPRRDGFLLLDEHDPANDLACIGSDLGSDGDRHAKARRRWLTVRVGHSHVDPALAKRHFCEAPGDENMVMQANTTETRTFFHSPLIGWVMEALWCALSRTNAYALLAKAHQLAWTGTPTEDWARFCHAVLHHCCHIEPQLPGDCTWQTFEVLHLLHEELRMDQHREAWRVSVGALQALLLVQLQNDQHPASLHAFGAYYDQHVDAECLESLAQQVAALTKSEEDFVAVGGRPFERTGQPQCVPECLRWCFVTCCTERHKGDDRDRDRDHDQGREDDESAFSAVWRSLPHLQRPCQRLARIYQLGLAFQSFMRRAPEERSARSFAVGVVEALVRADWTPHQLAALPLSVRLVIEHVLHYCKEDVPQHWPIPAYRLVGRLDCLITKAVQGEGAREGDAAAAAASSTASTRHQQHRQHLIGTSSSAVAAAAGGGTTGGGQISNGRTITYRGQAGDPDGLGDVVDQSELLFPRDERVREVCRLLRSSRPAYFRVERAPESTDHDHRERQQHRLTYLLRRSTAVPVGRGMLTLGSYTPILAEPLPVPGLCLAGKLAPTKAIVQFDVSAIQANGLTWPEFHNGVAAGLRVSPDVPIMTRNWIAYNKPGELSSSYAGIVLALGLQGHLSALRVTDIYDYLRKWHPMTTIALLLGVAAAHSGSADAVVNKMLLLHMPSLLPASLNELELSGELQAAALTGMGLLYRSTGHSVVAEFLLDEIGRAPSSGRFETHEAAVFSAGAALGMVVLGFGRDERKLRAVRELRIEDRLQTYILGGKKTAKQQSSVAAAAAASAAVTSGALASAATTAATTAADIASRCSRVLEGDLLNIARTAPTALVALGLMYLKSGNANVAARVAPPSTRFLLDQVRPDHLFFRVVSRNLIMWDATRPTIGWLRDQIPGVLRDAAHVAMLQALNSPTLVTRRKLRILRRQQQRIRAGATEGNDQAMDDDGKVSAVWEHFGLVRGARLAVVAPAATSQELDSGTVCQCYMYTLAGALFSLGLRFAGTADADAKAMIMAQLVRMASLRAGRSAAAGADVVVTSPTGEPVIVPTTNGDNHNNSNNDAEVGHAQGGDVVQDAAAAEAAGLGAESSAEMASEADACLNALKPNKTTVEACLVQTALAIGMVMAGTGDIDTLRVLRELRWRVEADVSYGTHLGLGMAIGLLFLGGGRASLSQSDEAIASLVLALSPKFPQHASDNQHHLQALRHLYVMATEWRELRVVDAVTGRSEPCEVEVALRSGERRRVRAPVLLPQLATVASIQVCSSRHYPMSVAADDLVRKRMPGQSATSCPLRPLCIQQRAPLSAVFGQHTHRKDALQTNDASLCCETRLVLQFVDSALFHFLVRDHHKKPDDAQSDAGTSGLATELLADVRQLALVVEDRLGVDWQSNRSNNSDRTT